MIFYSLKPKLRCLNLYSFHIFYYLNQKVELVIGQCVGWVLQFLIKPQNYYQGSRKIRKNSNLKKKKNAIEIRISIFLFKFQFYCYTHFYKLSVTNWTWYNWKGVYLLLSFVIELISFISFTSTWVFKQGGRHNSSASGFIASAIRVLIRWLEFLGRTTAPSH